MARRISAAEAKAKLPELMARVAFGGEKFVIERRGKPLAALVALEDLEKIEEGEDTARGLLALKGAWEGVPDDEIDRIFQEVVASRSEQASRPVPDLE